MRIRTIALAGLCALLGWTAAAEAAGPRVILALGNTSFIDAQAVMRTTGAEVTQDPNKTPLKSVAVLVLADIPLAALPAPMQQGLVDYVGSGGTVLISGGSRSFGSGGYKAVAPIIPFEIRADNDWRAVPFRVPTLVQPTHPIIAGAARVSFAPIGTFNDMNPRPGATEILQSPGGGTFMSPLIAEVGVGAGRVIGVAFDLSDPGGISDRDGFVLNTLTYLLNASRLGR